jgi:hypothetical protein
LGGWGVEAGRKCMLYSNLLHNGYCPGFLGNLMLDLLHYSSLFLISMARILAICWQIPALTQNLPFPPMNKHLQ